MKQLISYGLFALLAFVMALVAQAPATLLATTFAPALQPVQLAEVSGTLRAGQARAVAVEGFPLGSASWRWQPLALFGGRAAFATELAGNGGLQGAGTLGVRPGGTLEASGWKVNIPLAALREGGLPVPEFVTGLLRLDLDQLDYDGRRLQAVSGELQLRDARVQVDRPLALGDYTMALSVGEDGSLLGNLSGGSIVPVSGTVRFREDGTYQVQVQLRDLNQAPADVREFLQSLGPVRPDGSAAFQWSGRWAT